MKDDCTTIAGFPARWTEISLALAPAPSGSNAQNPAPTLHAYLVDRPEALFDQEALLRSEEVPEPPYWALLWIGARALAHRLSQRPKLAHPSHIADRTVLDLGCGLGVSGLAAAVAGSPVTFVDFVPECLEFVRASLERHGIENAEVRLGDFTRDNLGKRFDCIVAADIVYDPEAYRPLAEFLERHLKEGGEILLTESLRADAKTFVADLKGRGFNDDVEAIWVEEDGKLERTWLHRLTR